jgi:hypothetical protein
MKHIELFKDGFDSTVQEKIQPENWPYVGRDAISGEIVYTLVPEPWVTFTAEEDNSSIGLFNLSKHQTLEYSTDTTTWNTFDTTTNIPLNNRDKVYIRGVLSDDNNDEYWTQFKMSGKIAASGNCNAIWNHQDLNAQLRNYCGYGLFYECTSLTTAPELPATTLAEGCYFDMFAGCTSLTTAPELPAIELAEVCYRLMFWGCTSLTTAPELPATTLVENCYEQMFYNCSSLTTVPDLPATELADHCYQLMFYKCTSLTTAPNISATTLGYGCCKGMFSCCSSLTKGPEILPAQTLTGECYYQMFSHCTSLKVAPKISATTLANYCCTEMFWDCPNLEVAPVLLSPKVELESYLAMFHSCSNLKHVECHAIDMSASRAVYKMFYNINTEGTLIKHPDADWTNVNAYIPSGWTVIDAEL